MTTQYVSYNSYYGHECRWGDSVSATAVTIAPNLYRWDSYDVYASASYSERLRYEPSGSEGNWSFSKSASTSGGYSFLDNFSTRTYQRKESAYTIELRLGYTAGSSWGGSYHSVSGYATFTLTVPALQSWSVTFNANGGTGAPSDQTKYYGKTLTLSTTVPTRENYNFLGWATSSTAASPNYQPGASYTGNAALSLYAVWELAVVPPTATVTAYRVGSSSSTTEQGDGAYIYAKCDWMQGDNAVTGVTAAYTIDGSTYSATVSGTTSGASGTAQTWFALPTSDNASIAFTVTDGQASVNKSATVSSVNFPIYVHDKDKTDIYELHAGTLYAGDLSIRDGDISHTGTITKVYTNNGFTLEETTFYYTNDLVTIPIKFSATTNFAGNGSTTAASIPAEFAPPNTLMVPLFTTQTNWSDFTVGCLIMSTDGTMKFWSKSAAVWFGNVTYMRKPAGWTSS